MYNHNYGGFDYASTTLSTGWNPLGIAKVIAKPNINAYKPVTDGYTRPISVILLP